MTHAVQSSSLQEGGLIMWWTLNDTKPSKGQKLKQSAWLALGSLALLGFGHIHEWLAPASWAAGIACLSQLDHIWRH